MVVVEFHGVSDNYPTFKSVCPLQRLLFLLKSELKWPNKGKVLNYQVKCFTNEWHLKWCWWKGFIHVHIFQRISISEELCCFLTFEINLEFSICHIVVGLLLVIRDILERKYMGLALSHLTHYEILPLSSH